MMRLHEIESWALDIIDRVRSRQPIEDVRVELKTEWPSDTKKAARRIAAHANSARGEPILWLIGLDEKRGLIRGVDLVEFASWYSSVKAAFDELAPEPISINIPVSGVTVAALYFETDRAPFVIKVAEGGAVQREVPWREATGVRSATRSQLLRLLSPLQKLPIIEAVGCILKAEPWKDPQSQQFLRWEIYIALFITQPSQQETVIPSYRCSIAIEITDSETVGPLLGGVEFKGCGWNNANATKTGVSIKGSGMFEIRYSISSKPKGNMKEIFHKKAKLTLVLRPAGTEFSIPLTIDLSPSSTDDQKGRWRYGNHTFYG